MIIIADHSCCWKEMAEQKDIFVPSPIPDKLVNLLECYQASKALFAACDLGIFDKLHSSTAPQSAKEISLAIPADLDATTRLMDTLVGLEFLEKTKHGDQWLYNNSQVASKFLTSSSPESQLGYIAIKNNVGYPILGHLESAVREGTTQWMKPPFEKYPDDVYKEVYSHPEQSRLEFMSAMHNSSLHGCYAVAKAVDLSQYNSCCDLGGGAGTLAYALCQYNPHMKITVLDLQSVVGSAHHFRPSLELCPNQGNVSFVAGDFLKPGLPKADMYAISRVLHDSPEKNINLLLSNVFKSLPSGGGLLICELILNEDKSGPVFPLLQSLNMLVATGGRERTASEYKQLLEKHGFVDVQVKPVHPTMAAILCRKM